MPTVRALQHLFSSVEQGLVPEQGRGFQTVGVAEELVGTPDLQALERAAFYTVSPERRSSGSLPVKESFFLLPSGRFAVGRTIDFGADSLGREGNYLARHLVVTREDLQAIGGSPFPLLDTLAAEGPPDLRPRTLPPLSLDLRPGAAEFSFLSAVPGNCRASLAAAAAGRGNRTLLIIGDETRSRGMVRDLLDLLPLEERLKLTFSTHFYESDRMRPLFRLVTVASRAESPGDREAYTVFDIPEECPPVPSGSDYRTWLAECARDGRWAEIRETNEVLDRLRSGGAVEVGDVLRDSAAARSALWEGSPDPIAKMLPGDPERVARFLEDLPSSRPPADRMLDENSPAGLLGSDPSPENVRECLSVLRSSASPKAWRGWVKRWKKEAVVDAFVRDPRPWWKRLVPARK